MKYGVQGSIAAMLFSASLHAATIPQSGQVPWSLDDSNRMDEVSYLMAAAAKRPDTVHLVDFGNPKHAWLSSFDQGEYLEWDVSLSQGEEFVVTQYLNTAASGESFKLEVVGGDSLDFTPNSHGWSREEVGSLYIPAGNNTLKLTRLSNHGGVEIRSLELVGAGDKQARDIRIQSFKSDGTEFTEHRYGVMLQYGPWGYPQSGPKKSMEQQTADFDVSSFVNMIKSTGADYVIWSATWWEFKWSAPIVAVDNIVGHSDLTTDRDLFGEIATALDFEGIDFYLYYHTGQDSHLGYNSTQWWQAQNWPDSYRSSGTGNRDTFFNNWMSVVRDVGERYGELLDGWFFDDGGVVYYPAPFEQLGAAAKAGNPNRLISYNPWVAAHVSDFEDVSFGEECKVEGAPIGGNGILTSTGDKGVYGHCMHPMENTWGVYHENQVIGSSRYTVDSAYASVLDHIDRRSPVSFNMMMHEDGSVSPESLAVLQGLKTRIEEGSPCGFSCDELNDTDPKITKLGSWNVATNRNAGDFNDDVSWTQNNGDSVILNFNGSGIKVFMPTSGGQGDFEVYLDGVSKGVFSAYSSGYNPIVNVYAIEGLDNSSHTITLTKRSGTYMQLDKFEVYNHVTVLNDDNASIQYFGSWNTSENRPGGDYNNDVTYTSTAGDYAQFSFDGTAVSIVMPTYTDYADFEVFVDNVSQGVFSSSNSGSVYLPQRSVFEVKGLSAGNHTIRIEKESGQYLQIDAVQFIDSSQKVVRINNTDSSIEYAGSWQVAGNRGAGDYQDDVSYTGDVGGSAKLTFYGKGIRMIGPFGPDQAIADIYLDNVYQGALNTNSSAYNSQQVYFESGTLSEGQHTIEFRKSSGNWLQLDAFDIVR